MGQNERLDYAERRIVTILFCDVVGSTAMAEQLDAENWIDIINEDFEYMISPVRRYGGTVSQLRGDGLLALFGAPQVHEDDPDRAVLAGLAMIDETDPLRERVREQYGFNFDLRVGINTGPVVVGNVGFGGDTAYTAIGDAVNVASRVEGNARPGSVEITASTYRLLSSEFDAEPVGPDVIRGKADPVDIHRILGQRIAYTPHGDDQPDGAPFLGRDEELRDLRSVASAVLDGPSGRIAYLSGHAGMGKSRLIGEVREVWRARGVEHP